MEFSFRKLNKIMRRTNSKCGSSFKYKSFKGSKKITSGKKSFKGVQSSGMIK